MNGESLLWGRTCHLVIARAQMAACARCQMTTKNAPKERSRKLTRGANDSPVEVPARGDVQTTAHDVTHRT